MVPSLTVQALCTPAAIAEVIDALEAAAKKTPHTGYDVLAEHMKRIASVPIRAVASWIGNVMLTRECVVAVLCGSAVVVLCVD